MTDLTPAQKAELLAAASAATPGPWRVDDRLHSQDDGDYLIITSAERWVALVMEGVELSEEDTAFIALANPATIISLLAENAKLREALTPSGETKAAYIGEFKFMVGDYDFDNEVETEREVTVPWTTIKEVMAAISKRAALGDET